MVRGLLVGWVAVCRVELVARARDGRVRNCGGGAGIGDCEGKIMRRK